MAVWNHLCFWPHITFLFSNIQDRGSNVHYFKEASFLTFTMLYINQSRYKYVNDYLFHILTWLIMNIIGIFLLNFLWLRNTTMTVKFAMIPTEAVVLWMARMCFALELPALELFELWVALLTSWMVYVTSSRKSLEFVKNSIFALIKQMKLWTI